jgi:hypothetical protein
MKVGSAVFLGTLTLSTLAAGSAPVSAAFSGYYRLVARHSGKAVVIQSASTANSGDAIQWSYTSSAPTNDEWELVDLGTGYHRIVNRNSGRVLNVAGASTANGANVDQWSWAGANQQQFQMVDLGTGYHRIVARHSGKVLNVAGAGTADGANVDQWGWANVNQQQFQIVSIGGASPTATPTPTSPGPTPTPTPTRTPTPTPVSGGGPDNPNPSTSARVAYSGGRLVYYADAAGDTIPDFSHAGYGGGGVALPFVATQRSVSPVSGDDGANIQSAIDAVGAMTPDANGFRGAVQLAAGTYEIAGQLLMNKSGVVLRGSGNSTGGTVLKATGTDIRWLIKMGGAGGRTEVAGSRVTISDAYVAVGKRSFNVASTAGLAVGDRIVVERNANQDWIDAMGMDSCTTVGSSYDTADVNGSTCLDNPWVPSGYLIRNERKITAISGNRITLDVPVMHAIESRWGGGSVWKYTYTDRIQKCGLENLYADSAYAAAEDELHSYGLVNIVNIENAWVKNVTAIHFYHGVLLAGSGAAFVTVADSTSLDPVAIPTGGRMYPFHIDDATTTLVMRCFSRSARHDFVTGSGVPGPNVFLDSDAVQSRSEMGPHHRYATGTLWDDLTHDTNSGGNYQGVVNRGNSGSGHGWAGASQVFWNNVVDKMRVQRPPYAHNWSFGCQAPSHDGNGEYHSWGTPMPTWSLYVQQLRERKGDGAVGNIGY